MSKEKHAFPRQFLPEGYDEDKGMSLRDYFAAKAMQGMCATDMYAMAAMARDAYELADAMLAERAKGAA